VVSHAERWVTQFWARVVMGIFPNLALFGVMNYHNSLAGLGGGHRKWEGGEVYHIVFHSPFHTNSKSTLRIDGIFFVLGHLVGWTEVDIDRQKVLSIKQLAVSKSLVIRSNQSELQSARRITGGTYSPSHARGSISPTIAAGSPGASVDSNCLLSACKKKRKRKGHLAVQSLFNTEAGSPFRFRRAAGYVIMHRCQRATSVTNIYQSSEKANAWPQGHVNSVQLQRLAFVR